MQTTHRLSVAQRAVALLLTLAILLGSLVATPAFAQNDPVLVERFEFPVTLSDNQSHTLVGYLYSQPGQSNNSDQCRKRADTLQVALHGGSYNHKYWDAGVINGVDYSYAPYMARRCYTVLALDRLGTGESSKPSGDFINLANEADSIAQILTSLRTNRNPIHKKFKRIVLVGHSFGSMLSVFTLGEYGNVADGLVATGWINSSGVVPLDPALVQGLLANPYIISPAYVRTALFYYTDTTEPIIPTYDPAVVDHDNVNLADAMTRGYFLDAIAIFTARAQSNLAQIKALTRVDQVNVPVFVQVGDNDLLFPAGLAGNEGSFYSNAPSFTITTLTDIGHGFNVHLNPQVGWQQIDAWIDANIVNG